MDVLAHWQVDQSTRADGLLVRIGQHGDKLAAVLRGEPLPEKDTHTQPPKPPTPVPVKVIGGKSTPDIQKAAEQFHEAGFMAEWLKYTGADPAVLKRALEG